MSNPEPGGSQSLSGVRQQRSRGDYGAERLAPLLRPHSRPPRPGESRLRGDRDAQDSRTLPRASLACSRRGGTVPPRSPGPCELERRGLCTAPHTAGRVRGVRARAAAATRRAGVPPREAVRESTHPRASRVSSTSPSMLVSGPSSGPLMVAWPKTVRHSKNPAGNQRHHAKVPGQVAMATVKEQVGPRPGNNLCLVHPKNRVCSNRHLKKKMENKRVHIEKASLC